MFVVITFNFFLGEDKKMFFFLCIVLAYSYLCHDIDEFQLLCYAALR